jgi:hypothetical protein
MFVRRRISSDTWEQMKVAHASGVGLRELARKMHISEGTVLAYAKRHGWTRQLQVVKQQAAVQSTIAPAEAVADVINERKDKSRLHLSKYVEDASRTAAKSDGDLKIARNVKDVAAVHSTIWPDAPQQGNYSLPPLSVYAQQAVVIDRRQQAPTEDALK